MLTSLRSLPRLAVGVALLAAAACGGDSATAPVATTAALANRFALVGSRIGGVGQIGLSVAAQALAAGATPSAVTLDAALARAAHDVVALQTARGTGTAYQAVAIDVSVINVPGVTAPIRTSGVVTFRDENDFAFAMSAAASALGPAASFGGISRNGSVWVAPLLASAPVVTKVATLGACPAAPATAGYACTLGRFDAAFAIDGALPVEVPGFAAATGTRAASMAATTINGVSLTIDASKVSPIQ